LESFLNNEIAASRRWLWSNEKILWFQFLLALTLKVGTLLFALWLWQHNQISVADFVMSVSLSLLIIGEVRNISRRFIDLFEYIGNIANGVGISVREHEIVGRPGAQPLHITQGCIELRGVTSGYSPDSPVFENLDLRIEGGQRVGLVGYSGSG